MIKFSRYFVGILFIISGLIKLNDPIGFSIKLEEYFVVFGTTFLNPLVLILSVLICALEVLLGIALLFSIKPKQTSWLLLLLIVFFTLLTGYSAVSGKVTDCGCFGDAIKLTPWQSFGKDLILLIFILIIFLNRTKIHSNMGASRQYIIYWGSAGIALFFGIYCVLFLPVVDFLPYKKGNNIPELMKVPEGAIKDSFETIMYYEKDGITKEFTMQNYPWQDSTWKWVKTDNKLIREGYKPKIKDLRITDADGNDYSEDFITYPDVQLWVVAYNLAESEKSAFQKINELALSLEKTYKIRTIGLTSTNGEQTEFFRHESNVMYPFYYCDATTLKTMVRANPGILMIRNGVILNKWHYRTLPTMEELVKTIPN